MKNRGWKPLPLQSMLPPGWGLHFAGVVESGAPLAVWKRIPFQPSETLDARQLEVILPLQPARPSEAALERQIEETRDPVQHERLRRKLWIARRVGSGERGQDSFAGTALRVLCTNES